MKKLLMRLKKEQMGYQNFDELEVCKKVSELKNEIFASIKSFLPEEKIRLCNQLFRSSRSVATQVV